MHNIHVSDDGNPRPCRAKTPESCPVRGEDGNPAAHGSFASLEEAQRFAEKVTASKAEYYGFGTSEAPSSDLDPQKFYVSPKGYMGSSVPPGSPFMHNGKIYRAVRYFETGTFEMEMEAVDTESGEQRILYLSDRDQERITVPADEPLDHDDQSSYTVEWDEHSYLGSYAEAGGRFSFNGKLYTANSWEWNRALLRTTIWATNNETGEDEEIFLGQGSERGVKFTPITEGGEDRRYRYEQR